MIAIKHKGALCRRIRTLGTAIFVNDSRNILKFPTCIINVSEIDKQGIVWFPVMKPYDDISGLDKDVPAELKFYNKYCDYYITLTGEATISFHPEEIHGCMVPVKFRILSAKYHHCKRKAGLFFDNRISGFLTRFRNSALPVLRGYFLQLRFVHGHNRQ